MRDTLNARFSEPLKEYYSRRVIVWKDEDGEFADEISQMTLDHARILVMQKDHLFEIRRQIEVDYANENLLIYCPFAFSKPEDNWLLDVFLYGEEFRADYWSLLFSEIHVENTHENREYARAVADFFKSKERTGKFAALREKYSTPKDIRNGVFGVLCGIKSWGIADTVRTVLCCEDAEHHPLKAIEKYCGEDAFWKAVEEAYGYNGKRDLEILTCYLLVSAAMNTTDASAFTGLPGNSAYASQAYAFFWNWQREDKESLIEAYKRIERNYELAEKLYNLDRDVLMKLGVLPGADHALLRSSLKSFAENHFNTDDAETLLRERADMPWHEEFKAYYHAIDELKKMTIFYQAHRDGFHADAPETLWKNYTATLYKMDQYYRNFCNAYEKALDDGIMGLEDDLKNAAGAAERLYKNWFLYELNGCWTDQLDQISDLYSSMLMVPNQKQFYGNHIKHEDSRSFVIVSDALRYEVAMELTERLNGKLAGNTECTSMIGTYPTITPVGMAALLPHLKLTMSDDLRIACDDLPTEAADRGKVLRAASQNSVAVDFDAFRQMNRSQRQELIRPASVVYLYHDVIDKAGEAGGNVLKACEQAMQELAQMVRILANEISASSIYITSDHGFIYSRSPLDEYEKTDKEVVEGDLLVYKRRFAIVKDWRFDARAISMPLKHLNREDLTAVFPRGGMRFRMQGNQSPFMHGGLSLQELVVPLIHYQSKKAGQKGFQAITKADVELLGDNRKISNNLFTLTFWQKQACTGKTLPRQTEVHFEDVNGTVISDEHKIAFNSSAEENNERTKKVFFRLLGSGYDRLTDYYLIMKDIEDDQQILRIPFRIEIVFAQDFDF